MSKNLISSNKIEHRAINALEAIIDEHSTMDHQISANDKEMSWDGCIWIYQKNNGDQSKHNGPSRVPVQIKGHLDPNNKYINAKRITYSVDLDDLMAYATEKGVIYFQIFINDKKKEIFYSSLYPSKIADYLEKAKEKGNKSSISIVFTKLEKDADKLYCVAKQFNDEALKQGSAYTPLVQDRIRIDDFDKIKSISMSVVGAKDSLDAILRLSSGDICLYGKMEDDKYPRPLEWLDDSKFFAGREVDQTISIGEEIFYKKYSCIVDSDGGMCLRLSPNLEIRFSDGKINFNFKVNGDVQSLGNDSKFILRLLEANMFEVEKRPIKYTNPEVSEELRKRLSFLSDMYDTLNMIGFELDKTISQYTEEESEQITWLVNFRKGRANNSVEEGLSRYNWKYGDKYVPLLVSKSGDKIMLDNSVYTNHYAIFIPDGKKDSPGYRMPLFAYHEVDILSNLYKYDYDEFYEQLDNTDINVNTGDALIEFVLTMISVYDQNKDMKFLDLADYLLSKIKPYINEYLFWLNDMQIRIRRRVLQENELQLLAEIPEDDTCVAFGKYVLLGNKEAASKKFDALSKDKRKLYRTYPIYHLFEKL